MRRINTVVRKRIGYFGCLYAAYLAENHPYSWENLTGREDLIDILMIIHQHCQEQMQLYLETVGKDKLNKHKMSSELARMIYDRMIKEMKDMAFERCLDMLTYAEWMNDSADSL